MTELADLLNRRQVSFQIYPDDTQLWFPFCNTRAEAAARQYITSVFTPIEKFMQNHLKLNSSKVVFLSLSRKYRTFESLVLKLSCETPPSRRAWNLGVTLHSKQSFNSHISSLRSSCLHYLRNIYQIKSSLPPKVLLQLVLAVGISRADFSNSLLNALNRNCNRYKMPVLG